MFSFQLIHCFGPNENHSFFPMGQSIEYGVKCFKEAILCFKVEKMNYLPGN